MTDDDSDYGAPSTSFGDGPGLSRAPDPTQPEPRLLLVPSGILFGAFVGLVMGALVGAACCWLMWLPDFLNQATLIGATIGFAGGAGIGMKERKARRPDIATIICVAY